VIVGLSAYIRDSGVVGLYAYRCGACFMTVELSACVPTDAELDS